MRHEDEIKGEERTFQADSQRIRAGDLGGERAKRWQAELILGSAFPVFRGQPAVISSPPPIKASFQTMPQIPARNHFTRNFNGTAQGQPNGCG